MALYYVNRNAQPNGDHEVHKDGCSHMPDPGNRQSVGEHASCHGAVQAAKRFNSRANGCYWCSRECHTT